MNLTVICGDDRAIDLARLLRSPVIRHPPELVLVGPNLSPVPRDLASTRSVIGDPTRREVLDEAGVAGARTAIVLTQASCSTCTDARSLLVALAIEDVNPDIYTIVEVQDSSNLRHFDRTAVNETVSRSQLSELLIAQAAMNHHLSRVYRELYTYQTDGSEIYSLPIRDGWATFRDAFAELTGRRVIPIGLRRKGRSLVNPEARTPLEPGDVLWVVALEQP